MENRCTLDYAICSGGVGPLSAGVVVNLHDGSVFKTNGINGTSIPNEITKQLNKKNLTPLQFAQGIYKNVTAKGGGCSFGHIVNKTEKDRTDMAEFVNDWLAGGSVTASAGYMGIVGGVTIPHTEKWFNPKAKVGVELGVGTSGVNLSESITELTDTDFKLEFLNMDKKK